MLVYQNEINLPVLTSSTHVAPVADEENEGRLHFNGKCMYVQKFLGKDYDELEARQQRRRSEIKKHINDYTSPLKDTGLEAVSIKLQSYSGTTIDLKLKVTEETNDVVEKKMNDVQVFSYLTMKHKISRDSYHELTMQFPELPRSYKVISIAVYLLMLIAT